MQSTWQNLFHDTDHYLQSLKTCGAACGEFAVYVQWMETIIQETVVPKLKGALDQQGDLRVMGVGSGSDDSGTSRFRSHMGPYHETYSVTSSADVRNVLDHHGISYSQHHERFHVNITSCFDDASEEGSMVLDFLNHVTKFKESATEDLKQQVLERLASIECSETTGDEILLNNDCDTIIISKPR